MNEYSSGGEFLIYRLSDLSLNVGQFFHIRLKNYDDDLREPHVGWKCNNSIDRYSCHRYSIFLILLAEFKRV